MTINTEFHYVNKPQLDHAVDFFLQPYRYLFGGRDIYIMHCATTVDSSYEPQYGTRLIDLDDDHKIYLFTEMQEIKKSNRKTFADLILAIVLLVPGTLIGIGLSAYGYLASEKFKSPRVLHGLTLFYHEAFDDNPIIQGKKNQNTATIVTPLATNNPQVLRQIEYFKKTSHSGSICTAITDRYDSTHTIERNRVKHLYPELHYFIPERYTRLFEKQGCFSESAREVISDFYETTDRVIVIPEKNSSLHVFNKLAALIQNEPSIQNDNIVVQYAIE